MCWIQVARQHETVSKLRDHAYERRSRDKTYVPATVLGALVQYWLRAAIRFAEMGTDKCERIVQRAIKRTESPFKSIM